MSWRTKKQGGNKNMMPQSVWLEYNRCIHVFKITRETVLFKSYEVYLISEIHTVKPTDHEESDKVTNILT